MEQEMDTQELEYSVSLDFLSESEEYYIQSFENVLETEELEYSAESNSSDENDRSSENEMCESLQDLLLLKPYDFEPNIKDLPSDSNNQQKEKNENWRIGNTDWCICKKCQPMESEAESLCCLDTDEVPDDYFEGQKCVTSSEGFNTVGLSKIVLNTALSALKDLRGDSINYVNKLQIINFIQYVIFVLCFFFPIMNYFYNPGLCYDTFSTEQLWTTASVFKRK